MPVTSRPAASRRPRRAGAEVAEPQLSRPAPRERGERRAVTDSAAPAAHSHARRGGSTPASRARGRRGTRPSAATFGAAAVADGRRGARRREGGEHRGQQPASSGVTACRVRRTNSQSRRDPVAPAGAHRVAAASAAHLVRPIPRRTLIRSFPVAARPPSRAPAVPAIGSPRRLPQMRLATRAGALRQDRVHAHLRRGRRDVRVERRPQGAGAAPVERHGAPRRMRRSVAMAPPAGDRGARHRALRRPAKSYAYDGRPSNCSPVGLAARRGQLELVAAVASRPSEKNQSTSSPA